MSKIGNLIVNVGANTKEFNKELGKVNRDIGRLTGNIQKMGKELSMAVTLPIAALGVTAVQAFDKQAKAVAQVEAGLKATGNAAGFTSAQLQKMASDLQQNTLFGDEEILQGATAQLLTFTNIAGNQFARTQKAALDLATRLDGDLKSASIQLGKALNDPVANLSALSRSGIQFSQEQKELINTLVETGRLADAQTVILDELEKQYGGSAEAAAKAGTGGIKQLQNAFGDLQEEFGKIVVEMLPPVIDAFKSLVQSFSSMSAGTKKAIIVISGIAAAIGPILIVLPQLVKGFMLFRVTLLQSVVPALIKLNAVVLANPYVAAAVAVGVLGAAIYKLADVTDSATQYQRKMSDIMQQVGADVAVNSAKVDGLAGAVEDETRSEEERAAALRELQKIAPKYFGNLDMEKVKMGQLQGAVDKYRASLLNAAKAKVFNQQLEEAVKRQEELKAEIAEGPDFMDVVIGAFVGPFAAMRLENRRIGEEMGANEQLIKRLQDELVNLHILEQNVGDVVGDVVGDGDGDCDCITTLKDIKEEKKALENMYDMFAIDTSTHLDKKAKEVRLRGGTLEIEEIEMPEEDGFSVAELDFMREKVDEYYKNQEERMNSAIAMSQQLGDAMSNMFGQIIDGSATGAEAMKSMAQSVFKSLLNMAKAAAVASAAQSAAAKGPLAAYALPALTAASFGLVEGLLGAVAFADGGIVSGPTLGMVGEYTGARNNPEVIAPLDKLQNMIAGTGSTQQVIVHGKISGNDIELVRERGVDNLRRSRGGTRRN